MKELSDFKRHFDPNFIAYLRLCIDDVVVLYPEFSPIGEHLVRLATGGKRLRPFVLDHVFRSSGGSDISKITYSMFALELFQLFSLIHDDIMDGDTLRHGVETIHTLFDIPTAILVGDLCLIWAMRAITIDPKAEIEARSLFSKLAAETTIGQLLDTSFSSQKSTVLIEESRITLAVSLKTAKYTFIYPSLLGLSFAGRGSGEEVDVYTTLGENLGQAFQRLNDLSDILSTEIVLGKKPGSDISRDIKTHLSLYFDQYATEGQKAIYAAYRGQPLDYHDLERVRELFMVSGAIDHEKKAISKLLDDAKNIVHHLNINEEYKDIWFSIGRFLRTQLQSL